MKKQQTKTTLKNKILALFFSFMLLPWPFSLAQQQNTDPSGQEANTLNHSSTIDYTDKLFEITDAGAYDAEGNKVDASLLPVLKAAPMNPEDFTLSGRANSGSNTPAPSSNNFETYQKTLLENWGSQASFASSQLSSVQLDISGQKERFEELNKTIHETQQELEPIEHEIETLENQLNLYNGQIEQLKEKTRRVENLIAEKRTYLRQLMLELNDINIEFELLKGVATDFIRLLHEQNSDLTDAKDKATESLKLLLSQGTVNEQLIENSYLETMEETGRQVFHRLEEKREQAQQKQKQIEKEQEELDYLLKTLNEERQTLEQIRLNKTQLLEETQGKQEEYLRLLKEAEEEQKQLEYELSHMGDIQDLLRQHLALLQQGLNQVEGANSQLDLLNLSKVPNLNLNSQTTGSTTPFQVDPKLLAILQADIADGTKQVGLSWPVAPNKVTAQFSDSNYRAAFGVDHGAIDIRSPQGSNVYAVAPGMVVKVVPPTSTKYAYIVIAHGLSSLPPEYSGSSKGLTSLYGHVSRVDVKVGQIVDRGEIIGASGATPGSLGAGLRTTGAHMHFEVRDGGKLVNPLDYIILYGIDDDYLPEGWKMNERDRKYWPKGQ